MTAELALWNGELMPLAEVRVSVLDRGWLFGDAVYEVIRLYNGKPFLLAEHEARLYKSLAGLRMPRTKGRLGEKITQLVSAGGAPDGLVYVQISRGVAPRTHLPPPGMTPNELVFIQPFDEAAYVEKRTRGVAAALIDDRRWGRCDLKTVNLLGNVLGAEEARSRGADEAILVDADGMVTEGTHTSFFALIGGQLVTTPLSERVLPGITRDLVMALARKEKLKVREERVVAAALHQAQEVFLTGTLTEIFPVVSIDGLPIEAGRPGSMTIRLQKAFQAHTRPAVGK